MNTPALKKRIAIVLSALLIPLCAQANDTGIRVVGTSKISVAPDMAVFAFAIEDRGKDLKAVKQNTDDRAAKLIRLCRRMGVEAAHITSSQLAIRPQYNYQTKAFLGYEASREVNVVLNDLNRYTDLVNGAISSGITTIRNITLDTTKRDRLEDEALTAAAGAAKKKAEILAKSTGVKLGKVVAIDEGGAPVVRRVYTAGMRTLQEKGAFEPGRITVTATVTVTYSIQ